MHNTEVSRGSAFACGCCERSDYPYRTGAEHARGLAEIFGPDDLRRIERENALKLVPRWRAT